MQPLLGRPAENRRERRKAAAGMHWKNGMPCGA